MYARTKQEQVKATAYVNDTDTPAVVFIKIITSNVDSTKDIKSGQAFRKYRYARIKIKLSPQHLVSEVCADSGYLIILIERTFLTECLSNI